MKKKETIKLSDGTRIKKDKDFKSAVNSAASQGEKVTLEGRGNYFGYIEY